MMAHTDLIAFIGFISLFALMLLRVPVGMAMGLVGITGTRSGHFTRPRPEAQRAAMPAPSFCGGRALSSGLKKCRPS